MTNASLASEYVADTMALVLHLEKRRSSSIVKSIFDSADRGDVTIHIPAMVFAEILYLSERNRITLTLTDVETHFQTFRSYQESPMSFALVENARQITDIPELHDRLIAATAKSLSLDLLTNDPKIQASKFVDTVW